jgi:hypothetical protein
MEAFGKLPNPYTSSFSTKMKVLFQFFILLEEHKINPADNNSNFNRTHCNFFAVNHFYQKKCRNSLQLKSECQFPK